MAKKTIEDTDSKIKEYVQYWTQEALEECKREAKKGQFKTRIYFTQELQSFFCSSVYISDEAAQKAVLKVVKTLRDMGFACYEEDTNGSTNWFKAELKISW